VVGVKATLGRWCILATVLRLSKFFWWKVTLVKGSAMVNKNNLQELATKAIKIVFSLFLFLSLSQSAWADRPKVGLVLGGGGDYIAGTSMGAVVGALYASGNSAAEIEAILRGIDWQRALSDKGPRSEHSISSKKNDVEFAISFEAGFRDGKIGFPTGLLQGQQLELLLRRLFADVGHIKNFDELSIPFRAVATNLATMQPMIFDSGDLSTAVRASMSVPGAFEPVHYNDMVLVDGGIVDNVPADVAREMGADILIIVDVRTPLFSAAELNSIGFRDRQKQ